MQWQGWFALALTVSVLLLLALTKIRAHVAMMGALTILSVAGLLTPAEALAGFSNSGLITVAAMFVVACGIHGSGGIDILVNRVLGTPSGHRAALTRMSAPVVILSAFLNNTPVVATMIPAVSAWARKIDISPSKLMIPLSYTAILGGTITLIGTSTNLIVDGQYQTLTGQEGFSLFSITAVALPVAVIGLLFMWLAFPRLLPNRNRKETFENLREFTLEVQVAHDGPLVGASIQSAGLRNLKRVFLVEIERNQNILTAVSPEETLRGGDRLVFAGDTEAISDLLRVKGIIPSTDQTPTSSLRTDRAERCLVEVVVSPHCSAVGLAIREAQFRDRYGAVVLAVARHGERVKGNLGSIKLKAGDTLLLEARPAFVSRQRYNKDFLLISDLEKETPRHSRAILSWIILFALVFAATFDILSMLNAALMGAGLMLLTGCCTVSQAERSLDLEVLITIAASLALGAALEKTGVAGFVASQLTEISDGRPWLLLLLAYVTVSLLTEVITNNAAAVIMLPIVLSLVEQSGLNAEPFVFAIMMAASASFATPLGYQTNLMVYGPGGYRFNDFLRVGIPMNIIVGFSTVTILCLFWPLSEV
ncbi:MAG: SLC13 family permease [unclassified Hahellaceae]|nr:SLC13 family permease [Hahellaceae bacterium]|tara:strand:+ start:16177 stop:17955 length:1779 start_codon:yes stop_codon:yes gene_type:complete